MDDELIDWAWPLIQAEKECRSLTDLLNQLEYDKAEKSCDALIAHAMKVRQFISHKKNGVIHE